MLNPRRKTFSKSNCNCRAVHNMCGENAYNARAAQGLSLGRPAQILPAQPACFVFLSAFFLRARAAVSQRIYAYFLRDNMSDLDFCNVSAGKPACFWRDNIILLSRRFARPFTCAFATFPQVNNMSHFASPENLIVALANGGEHDAG